MVKESTSCGWVKIPRSIKQWRWYDDVVTKAVFLHLLVSANHKDNEWHDITIRRGQLLTSYLHLSRDLNIPLQRVKTAIKRLKSTDEITCESTNQYTLVTICGFDSYQGMEFDENPQNNLVSSLQSTCEQQSVNNRLTTNKNDKNNKNEKEIESVRQTPAISIIKDYWREKGFYKSDPEDFYKYYSYRFPLNWQYYADKWEEREKEKSCEKKGLPHKKIDYTHANLTF